MKRYFVSVLVMISALARNNSALAQSYGGLGFDGSSQYVDFGPATNLGSATFTKNTTTGVYTTTIGSFPANTVIGLKLPACP